MEKISESLRNSVYAEPGKMYDVLITLQEGTDIKKIPLDNYQRLMDNILSATVAGSDLQKLSVLDVVKSIEPNEEMGIL